MDLEERFLVWRAFWVAYMGGQISHVQVFPLASLGLQGSFGDSWLFPSPVETQAPEK